MKTRYLYLLTLLAPFAAMAQGKITFGNNSERLYVMPGLCLPADVGLANQPIPLGSFPSGVTLVAGLYAGTSSTSLTLQSSTILLTGTGMVTPGIQALRPTILSVPGGVPQWFQVAIWDSAFPSPYDSTSYFGFSPLFQSVPGTSLAYPLLYQTSAPVNSTWAPGNIVLGWIPEPSSSALLLLCVLVLHLTARRNHQTDL